MQKENDLRLKFVDMLMIFKRKHKINQKKLSKYMLCTTEHISRLKKGTKSVTERTIRDLENYLKELDQRLIDTSKSEPTPNALPEKQGQTRKVPVVSYTLAGSDEFCGNFDDLGNQFDEWIDTDCKDKNAFALVVQGDSMEPEFHHGDRVVFHPHLEPQTGEFVAARLRDSGSVFIKKFFRVGQMGEKVKLVSINENYPPIERMYEDFRWIYPFWQLTRNNRRR